MKTLAFNDNAGTTMSFLTDCIDGSEQFSVLQILTNIQGVETVGIPDSIVRQYLIPIELGKCYMLNDFIAYATARSFNLLVTDEGSVTPTYLVDNRF
jgi:hypothetical protein